MMLKKFLLIAFAACALPALAAAAWWYGPRYLCDYDLACLKQYDPWLRDRYDPDVPLLQAKEVGEIDDLQDDVWGVLAKYLSEFNAFHDEHKQRGRISCAVVANGVTALNSGYGALIDSHDYVFRMNSAPIDGFEADVGKKVTFDVINSGVGRIRDYGQNHFAIIWGAGGGLIGHMGRQVLGQMPPDKEVTRLKVESPATQRIVVYTDAFKENIEKVWFRPKTKLNEKEWPGTGFRTIALAVHLCDSLDLFGFGADEKGKMWHYFKKGGLWNGHRPDYEAEFLQTLAERRIARLYKGDTSHKIPPPKAKK